jgi:hypothetical protein
MGLAAERHRAALDLRLELGEAFGGGRKNPFIAGQLEAPAPAIRYMSSAAR